MAPGALGLRRRQGDSGPLGDEAKSRGLKTWPALKCRAPSDGGDTPGAGKGTDAARRSPAAPNAQDLKTEGGNDPAAQGPDYPGAPHDPTAGYLRPQLLFVRVAPGGAARTVFPGSRGGRP